MDEQLEFNVLGCGHGTLSLVFESLHRCFGNGVRVKIIQNVRVDDSLPFQTDGLETKAVHHTRWDDHADVRIPNLIGVYQPETKRTVFEFFRDHYAIAVGRYATLVHPASEVATTARLGPGSQVGPGVVLAPFVSVGALVSINRGVMVGHHTSIGARTSLNPGVQIAGCCEIGEGVTIGIGTAVVDGVRIGDGTTVAAGSLVRKDLPPGALASGTPARVLRVRR